jgi:hypothetical protein
VDVAFASGVDANGQLCIYIEYLDANFRVQNANLGHRLILLLTYPLHGRAGVYLLLCMN